MVGLLIDGLRCPASSGLNGRATCIAAAVDPDTAPSEITITVHVAIKDASGQLARKDKVIVLGA